MKRQAIDSEVHAMLAKRYSKKPELLIPIQEDDEEVASQSSSSEKIEREYDEEIVIGL